MNTKTIRSAAAIFCVCIFLLLMCAFFVDAAHAASVTSGTTTRKEQTIKMTLKAGVAVITVKDKDSWVFAQLQKAGKHKIGKAVNGEMMLAGLGQQKTFTVQVKDKGTYYLYLHGVNKGASYTVQQFSAGGDLKNGVPRLGTSFADNTSILYYRIEVPGTGTLKVSVKDASYLYPGYSKIQLKKGSSYMSGEEHLIKGLGFATTYGVTKGVYYIGVRSSSELYKITAGYTAVKPAAYGESRSGAAAIARKTTAKGIFEPVAQTTRWYRIDLPEKSANKTKSKITVRAVTNNRDLAGGVTFSFRYKTKKKGKYVAATKKCLLNNNEQTFYFGLWAKKARTVYVKVTSTGNASGLYTIKWR